MRLIAFASRSPGLILIGVVWLIVFGAILMTIGRIGEVSGGSGILDFEVGYSRDTVDAILGSYGEAGMSLYRRVQMLDLLNPALYSLILAGLTFRLWRGTGRERLALVALLGGLGDYLENVTLFLMVRAYPEVSDSLTGLSSTLSLLKNGFLVIAVLPLLFGFLRRLRS